MRKPVAVGVAGGTGSGKTTVAEALLRRIGASRIAFIAQDSYYLDIDWKDQSELLRHNFDHPDALDHALLISQIATLKERRPIEAPIYDFVRHRRMTETRHVEPQQVILVEGILLFAEPVLRDLLDLKIYVDTDADVRLARRIRRDLDERGRALEDVLRQYLATVRPMHLEFVEPSKRWADVIVPEGGENEAALEMVTAHLEQLLS